MKCMFPHSNVKVNVWVLMLFSMGQYKKEDAALLGMQFWLLVLSFVAVSDVTERTRAKLLTYAVADTVFFHSADVRCLLSCSHPPHYSIRRTDRTISFDRFAIICTRVLSTAWAAYSIHSTLRDEALFRLLLVDADTPCHFNLFPTHFKTRLALTVGSEPRSSL